MTVLRRGAVRWDVRWWIVIVCASTACGRIAFDERGISPDAGPSDGPAVRSCTNTAFDQLPAELQPFGNGTVDVSNGVVRFSISGTLDSEAGLQTTVASSFIGHSTSIQVMPSLTQSASTSVGWHERTGDLIGVHLEMDGFNLKLNQYNPTQDKYDEFVSLPYDAVEYAWWQMREQGGEIVAEVSRDGVVWNLFGTVSGRDLSMMTWDFGVGSYVGNVAPSETSMDNAAECTL